MNLIIHNRSLLLIIMLLLGGLLAACGGSASEAESTAEPIVETIVVVATPTAEEVAAEPVEEAAAETVEETAVSIDTPVLEVPTAAPGEPTVTSLTDLNIRTGPGTNYQTIGALRANSSARILGRSSGGSWWKIECPPGAGSECWVSAGAQYSQASDAADVPVAAAPPAPAQATAVASTGSTATATATATVSTTGDNTPTATATLADGQPTATATATLAAGQSTATATATLAAGQPTATATTTSSATATSTTTVPQIAPFDNDSLQNPASSVFFSPTGTRNFSYSNDISYPNGDQDDWVEFEFPNNANSSQSVWLTLECNIVSDENVQVIANISENGVTTTKRAFCNEGETQLTVNNTQVQQVRIYFQITGQAYATYTLTIVGYR